MRAQLDLQFADTIVATSTTPVGTRTCTSLHAFFLTKAQQTLHLFLIIFLYLILIYLFLIIFLYLILIESCRPPQRIPPGVSASAAKTATSFGAIESSTPRATVARGVKPSIAPKDHLFRHVMRP